MQNVLSTDTPNAGRVKWNDNDTEISNALNTHKTSADHDSRYYTEGEVDAALAVRDNNLNAHKSSADHDSRYYTETEVDAALAVRDNNLNAHKSSGDHDARYVQKTGNETIAGEKTFTSDVKCKTGSPSFECQDSNNATTPQLCRMRGASLSGTPVLNLEVYEGGGYKSVMQVIADANQVFFDRPLTDAVSASYYATQDYVNKRVRSGSAYMTGQTPSLSASGSSYTKIGSDNQVFAIPPGARITRVIASALAGTSASQWDSYCNVDPQQMGGLVLVHVSTSANNTPTIAIRDRNGGNFFSFTASSSPGSSAIFSITLVVTL
jgi:hypothetical protein